MGLKIADLLKWRTSVILLDQNQKPILDEKNQPVTVWLRVIGDDDLDKAHRAARLTSSTIRKELKDTKSALYRDRVAPIKDASKEDCEAVVLQYRISNLEAEARANVEREDLVTLEQVAIDADAATLEEQEKLDAEIQIQEERYEVAVKDYIETRTEIIKAELASMSLEDIRKAGMDEISGVIALSEFFNELMEQKIFRGSFTDKACKERAFDDIEEVKSSASTIRQQLFEAYIELEYSPDQVKK